MAKREKRNRRDERSPEPERTRYGPDGVVVDFDDETAGATVVTRWKGDPIPQPEPTIGGRQRLLLPSETELVEGQLLELVRWGDRVYHENIRGPGGTYSQCGLAHTVRISARSALNAPTRVEAAGGLEALRAARDAVSKAMAAERDYRLADFKKYNEPDVLDRRKATRQRKAAAPKGGEGKRIAAHALRLEAVKHAKEWSAKHPHIRARLHVAKKIAPDFGKKPATIDGWLAREGWSPSMDSTMPPAS